ncbi:MAG: ROK family transcriptional regulator [Chloroflexota bacterium]
MTLRNPFQPNIIPTTPIYLSSVEFRAVQLLRQQGNLSRTVIADEIGYSPSKITGVVNNLLKQGIIEELDESTYTGGRRAKDLYFNPAYGYLLSISIERDKLDLVLSDFAEQVRVRKMFPINIEDGTSAIMQTMRDFVIERLQRFDIPMEKVLGVGVSLPAAIDQTNGIPYGSAQLPGWGGYQIVSFLRESFPHAIVHVAKDANAMVFAEYRKGRGKGYNHVLYILVDQSVRAGLILNSQLYRGIGGRAGDIGDILLPDGEKILSLNTLVDTLPLADGRSLSTAALEGSADAMQIIEQGGQLIGQVIANMVTLLDPQLVLIGGRATALGHPFLASIRRSILEYAQSFSTEHLQVELASLRDASLTGMLALVAERIFAQET